MRIPRPGRFGGFLLVGAALIGGAALLSGLTVGSFFERHVLAHEAEHAAKVMRLQALKHRGLANLDASHPEMARQAVEAFQRELVDIRRLTIYDRSGRIVWSDEARLIGQAFPGNPLLARALGGEVTAALHAPDHPEHRYDEAGGYVAEAYVPVSLVGGRDTSHVIAVHTDATRVVAEIREGQRLIWAFAASLGLFLYVALAFVVWRAWTSERQAVRRLEQANEALQEAQAQLVEQERLAAAGQVVVGLHHAILNPLTGVLGALRLQREADISPRERAEALAEAETEVHRIEQLVRRLPTLRRATGTPYVGGTTMLDLERDTAEEEQR